ncbi:Hypothetical predicted protein [Podarcis lilfordi]|uniref:Secreted protein n=1 Tax=Podarcis lilfordi TaxID=74358 RepID=A0AA35LKD5_9SAUR|nr:Hypothetical predicted protein [Podarcis lilfordi]
MQWPGGKRRRVCFALCLSLTLTTVCTTTGSQCRRFDPHRHLQHLEGRTPAGGLCVTTVPRRYREQPFLNWICFLVFGTSSVFFPQSQMEKMRRT